jgi:hypothetical protein
MAIALILDFPGGTKKQYDEVVAKMELDGRLAPGGLFHAAGSYEGGWRVVDVWEDRETYERFRDAQIVPNATAVGLSPPSAREIDVHERKPGSGAAPALVQIVTLPGLDAEGFAAADAKILAGGPPESITFHVNGPVEGGWCVVDAWDSIEARNRFLEERVKPAVGEELAAPPEVEDLMVEATLATASGAPA